MQAEVHETTGSLPPFPVWAPRDNTNATLKSDNSYTRQVHSTCPVYVSPSLLAGAVMYRVDVYILPTHVSSLRSVCRFMCKCASMFGMRRARSKLSFREAGYSPERSQKSIPQSRAVSVTSRPMQLAETVVDMLASLVELVKDVEDVEEPSQQLIYRGLRVRMGLHSGTETGLVSPSSCAPLRTHVCLQYQHEHSLSTACGTLLACLSTRDF